jgi:hypothetical protein
MDHNEVIGGPSEGMEKCPRCEKEHWVYRGGSYDWEPQLCSDCRTDDIVERIKMSQRNPKTAPTLDEWVEYNQLERLKKNLEASCEVWEVDEPDLLVRMIMISVREEITDKWKRK